MAQTSGSAKVKIGQIHFGGISLSKYEGKSNSVAELVGVNIHGKPGVISANQQLKKDSGSTVTESIGAALNSTDGNSYFFSKTSGKIWQRTSAGVWSLIHTTTSASSSLGCLGAIEFEGYIYWATKSFLHRIPVSGTGNWSANDEPDYAALPNEDDSYHPMVIIDSRLYIGDGSSVHQLYQDALAVDALRVLSFQRVSCLGKYDYDLLAGTIVDNNINKSTLYRWNRWSDSWNFEDDIEEVGINAIIPMDNGVIIQAGPVGNLYAYAGGVLELLQQIPGEYTDTSKTTVSYNAVASLNGKPLFAPSNVSGNPCKQGIYSYFSSFPTIYPRVINLEYLTSTNATDNLEIGTILVRGTLIFVSWKRNTSYGVDVIDTSNKYNGAYLASKVIYADPNLASIVADITIPYVELPENTNVNVYVKKNFATSWGNALTVVNDTMRNVLTVQERITGVMTCEFKFEFVCSGNTTPLIGEITISFDA